MLFCRRLGGCFVLLLTTFACISEVPVSNPYDPKMPPEQQVKSVLQGTILSSVQEDTSLVVVEGADILLDGPTEPANNPISSESDGTFQFNELVPGTYTVSIRHASHFPYARDVILSAGEDRVVNILLTPLPSGLSEDTGHLTGVIHLASELHLPESKQDHSNILVEVVGQGVRTTTNPAGVFDLYLSEGDYQINLSAANHVPQNNIAVSVVQGEDTELSETPLVLASNPGTVSGRVMLEGLSPGQYGNIDVVLFGSESTKTNTDGDYTITDVPAGDYMLTASLANYGSQSLVGVSVKGGLATAVPDITLLRSRGRITGQVELIGSTDGDFSGVTISLLGTAYSDQSSSDGAFAIESVPTNTYDLVASKDEYSKITVGSVIVDADTATDVGLISLVKQQGTFQLDGGADYTNAADRLVVLSMDAPDNTQHFKVSGTGLDASESTDWRPYVPTNTETVLLSDSDGEKTVAVVFRDDALTESPEYADTIILDRAVPIPIPGDDAMEINNGAAFVKNLGGIVTLSFHMMDPGTRPSGIRDYRVSTDAGDAADGELDGIGKTVPTDPDPSWLSFASSATFTLDEPGTQGAKTAYVQFRDFAGNTTTVDATYTANTVLDYSAPSIGAAVLSCPGSQAQAGYCDDSNILVTVTCTDNFDPSGNGASWIALANEEGFLIDDYRAFAGDVRWLVSPGDGTKTVYIKVKDAAGNPTSQITRTIELDTLAPQDVSVQITGTAANPGLDGTAASTKWTNTEIVDLSLEATDDNLYQVKVANTPSFASSAPQTWATSISGHDLTTGLSVAEAALDGDKWVWVRVTDQAGHSSIASASIAIDRVVPPLHSVVFQDGVRTASATANLEIQAEDAAQMQIDGDLSNPTAAGEWESFFRVCV